MYINKFEVDVSYCTNYDFGATLLWFLRVISSEVDSKSQKGALSNVVLKWVGVG